MRLNAALAVLALFSPPLSAGESDFPLIEFASDPPKDGRLAFIVRDGTDRVWAIAREQGSRLFRLENEKWSAVPLEGFPSGLTPLALERNDDGNLIGLWKDDSAGNDLVLTRHVGMNHTILARIAAKLKDPILLPLRNGGALVTEKGPQVLSIEKDGANPAVDNIPDELFVVPKKQDDGRVGDGYVAIRATEDEKGTIWIWSHAMKKFEYLWRLRSPVVMEKGKFTPEELPGVEAGGPISLIVSRGPDVVNIAASGVGVFEISKNSPDSGPLVGDDRTYLEKFFFAHGDWFFISTPRPTKVDYGTSDTFRSSLTVSTTRFYEPGKRTSSLLRQGNGNLEPLTRILDDKPKFGWLDRPVVEMADGFWIGAKTGQIVFVSCKGEKTLTHLDWRDGLPLKHPEQLARAGDNNIVALDSWTGKTCLVHLDAVGRKSEKPLRIDLLETQSLLLEDSEGRVRGVLGDYRFAIWEKGEWREWDAPPEVVKMKWHRSFGELDKRQGWVIPGGNGPCAVCDFSTGEWKVFDTVTEALAARMTPNSRIEMGDHPSLAPFSSSDTPPKIARLSSKGTLRFFDQKEWKEWQISEIGGPDSRVTGTPYFRGDGVLILPMKGYLWELRENMTWVRTEKTGEHVQPTYRQPTLKPPQHCPVENVISTIYDRQGVCWMRSADGALWKSLPGCAVPLLDEGDPNPVSEGASFRGICSDGEGNAFIRLEFGGGDGKYLAVRARYPRPENDPKLIGVEGDSVNLDLGKAAWKRWRIDDGEWSLATDAVKHRVAGVLPGDHKIEILAYNAELTPAEESAFLTFSVSALDPAKLKDLISQLRDGDLAAREIAARSLRNQGPDVLPKLREALSTGNESLRWWLRAVIQRIEEDRHQSR